MGAWRIGQTSHLLSTLELGLLFCLAFRVPLARNPVFIEFNADDATRLADGLRISERVYKPVLCQRSLNSGGNIDIADMLSIPHCGTGHGVNEIERSARSLLGCSNEKEEMRIEIFVKCRAVAHVSSK